MHSLQNQQQAFRFPQVEMHAEPPTWPRYSKFKVSLCSTRTANALHGGKKEIMYLFSFAPETKSTYLIEAFVNKCHLNTKANR